MEVLKAIFLLAIVMEVLKAIFLLAIVVVISGLFIKFWNDFK